MSVLVLLIFLISVSSCLSKARKEGKDLCRLPVQRFSPWWGKRGSWSHIIQSGSGKTWMLHSASFPLLPQARERGRPLLRWLFPPPPTQSAPSKGKGPSTFMVALPTSANTILLVCLEVISKVILDPTNLTTSVDQECNIVHKQPSSQRGHFMCLTLGEREHGKKAKTL